MTQKPTPEDLERQNLLARINELEQIFNNEHAVGRQKMKYELADDYQKDCKCAGCAMIADWIRNWQPRGE